MRISISAETLFIFPLEKVFDIAAEVGFDGVELVINQEFQRVNCRRLIPAPCDRARICCV